jgi:hypothetical protein
VRIVSPGLAVDQTTAGNDKEIDTSDCLLGLSLVAALVAAAPVLASAQIPPPSHGPVPIRASIPPIKGYGSGAPDRHMPVSHEPGSRAGNPRPGPCPGMAPGSFCEPQTK